MLAPRFHDCRPFLAVFAALILIAWLALLVCDISPYGVYLDHRLLGERNVSLGQNYAGLAALFVAGWTLMTVAMMLPSIVPLLLLFRRLIANRPRPHLLMVWLVVGYIAVWVVIGGAAHLGDVLLHTAIERSHWLSDRSWLLGVLVLAAAGSYQFTPLKYYCLEKCRSPYSFIVENWRGGAARLDALRLGMRHGLFCVGCCWSLMLLMFALGAGSVVWMLALSPVMAAERNLPWGKKLSKPLGLLLLAASLGLLLAQATAGPACAHNGVGC